MPPLLISLGDPAGIGPEVVEKALQGMEWHDGCILVGHPDSLTQPVPHFNGTLIPNTVQLIPITDHDPVHRPNDPINARIAHNSIITALNTMSQYTITGLVTAPISKEGSMRAGLPHFDHTTLLQSYFQCPGAGMAFYSEPLKVMLASIHIPLSDVPDYLSTSIITQSIQNAIRFANQIGIDSPRIGISGLNPHAGENGTIGSFETRVLSPIIESLNHQLPATLIGPVSPDVVFRRAVVTGDMDVVVALYHDQGLIPIKLLAFDTAVNVTIGLPICRTSPDHGTAYDIAHKNQADPGAMVAAIRYIQQFG